MTKGSGEEGMECCETYCNGCMNAAWALCWGGSQSTKPCIFPCKVVAGGDERYLVCAAGAAAVVSVAILQQVVVPVCVVPCVFLNLWLQIGVEWLHGCSYLVLPCA